jgi:hypothetical protein
VQIFVVMLIGNPFSGEITTFKPWNMEKLFQYFKQLRVVRMAIAVIWSILPMPIAEEIGPNITQIAQPNGKRSAVVVKDPKRRRTSSPE